eukprot:GDKI01043675.1.p1 GENE.GDKI01043675.1~~GDKI01043675.1.p1  ORF type:complete len:245 (-),score=46.04 GDKI01043675.1:179-880(-)
MPFHLGATFPDFTATVVGGGVSRDTPFEFYKWKGGSWCLFFSHPADFTPVCTTELAKAAQLHTEFAKRNVKLLGLSCSDADSHQVWSKDVMHVACMHGGDTPYPMIADGDRRLAEKLGIMDPDERDVRGLPLTCRAVFVIGPDNKVKASVLYPANTGRDFSELLRVVDALQLTMLKPVATPEGWRPGDRCMVQPILSNKEAKSHLPAGFEQVCVPSQKGYLRYTPDPRICSKL